MLGLIILPGARLPYMPDIPERPPDIPGRPPDMPERPPDMPPKLPGGGWNAMPAVGGR